MSGVEGYNALGEDRRFHAHLCNVFNKVCIDSPGLDGEYVLTIAVKDVNDKAGPSTIFPSFLLFGVAPRLPTRLLPLLDSADRMMTLWLARDEMARITARTRIETALLRNTPGAAYAIIRIYDTVLWYRDKPIGRWTDLFAVTSVTDSVVWVNNGNRLAVAPINRVNRYYKRRLLASSPTEPSPDASGPRVATV